MTILKDWLANRFRLGKCTTIVLHSTDGKSAASSIAWLRKIKLSYHYIIERGGEVIKCVPLSRVAFHAGKSEGPDGSNVNTYSIGCSFANHESHREDITDKQVAAMKALVKEIAEANPDIKYLTTHYAISPGRKSDPAWLSKAELFEIAEHAGLTVWGVKR